MVRTFPSVICIFMDLHVHVCMCCALLSTIFASSGRHGVEYSMCMHFDTWEGGGSLNWNISEWFEIEITSRHHQLLCEPTPFFGSFLCALSIVGLFHATVAMEIWYCFIPVANILSWWLHIYLQNRGVWFFRTVLDFGLCLMLEWTAMDNLRTCLPCLVVYHVVRNGKLT